MTDLGSLLGQSATGLFNGRCAGADLLGSALDEGWGDGLRDAPTEAVAALFDTQGDLLVAASPLLDLVVLEAVRAALPEDLLPCSPLTTAVVYPVSVDAAGLLAPRCRASDSGQPRTAGVVLAAAERATDLLVPVLSGNQVTLGRYAVPAEGVALASAAGADPTLGLRSVMIHRPPDDVLPPTLGQPVWRSAVAAGRRALTHELLAIGRHMLRATVAYAAQRTQFGRPIGSFQAVRHRLAEVHVALESAALALELAEQDHEPDDAALSKCLAGHAHVLASEVCLQVHGAIGFTAEHDLHRYSRRGALLNLLLGSADEVDHAIGAQLLADGHAPPRGALAR